MTVRLLLTLTLICLTASLGCGGVDAEGIPEDAGLANTTDAGTDAGPADAAVTCAPPLRACPSLDGGIVCVGLGIGCRKR